jgi:hypothetical protein
VLQQSAAESVYTAERVLPQCNMTAPFDEDGTVLVSDGCRSPYILVKPCQRTKAGWVVSGKKTPLAVVPLKLMPFQRVPIRQRHRRAVAALGRLRRQS